MAHHPAEVSAWPRAITKNLFRKKRLNKQSVDCSLIFQNVLSDLAPCRFGWWMMEVGIWSVSSSIIQSLKSNLQPAGCRGIIGPVPPPLWIRAYLYSIVGRFYTIDEIRCQWPDQVICESFGLRIGHCQSIRRRRIVAARGVNIHVIQPRLSIQIINLKRGCPVINRVRIRQ